jgi:cation diffusion facilitator CzcD-associated flavoprotein CzcO
MNNNKEQTTSDHFDAVVVGAGFAGLYALHKLRSLGLRVCVFEAGDGVGGTWFWNRYPGARCDVESMEYSYQFSDALEQEWEWSERYAGQPEILRYLEHVAERFDLYRDIQFETRVQSAHFDDAGNFWHIEALSGTNTTACTATFCIMATGNLSSAQIPEIEGLDRFQGPIYHTGQWPREEIDFTGKRVGVVGTGSSGVQAIPVIAQQAAHLTVFQRTATYSVPSQNAPLDADVQRSIKQRYKAVRAANKETFLGFGSEYPSNDQLTADATEEERQTRYEEYWQRGGLHFMGVFIDLMLINEANDSAADFVRNKISEQVDDPDVAQKLMPAQVLGCKRLCSDKSYYETFNRSNVSLVDVSASPISSITETGIVAGEAFDLDAIVFATGFDAMTGTLQRIDIRGRNGLRLAEKWAEGPKTYIGLGSEGFPNFFIIAGPGSPSVLSNFVPSIEGHVDWIADCFLHLRDKGLSAIEATAEAEEEWGRHVNEIASFTLYPSCNSWYLGSNIPGKPRVFMPYLGYPTYVEKIAQVVENGYEGFTLS